MEIKISNHFNLQRLIRFTISPVGMMFFISIYSVVDGIFVANFVGKNALASINIVYPLVMIIAGIGFMLGTGGAAEIGKTMGKGEYELAKEYFTDIILTIFVSGVFFCGLCVLNLEKICIMLGASEILLEDCMRYGGVLLSMTPLFMIQNAFQSLFSTAEKPKLGFYYTVASGIGNIIFDYLFIVVFNFGILGAAIGTSCSFLIGAVFPCIYFFSKNNSLLRFKKSKYHPLVVLRSCVNGISEMITQISSSFVSILINKKLIEMIGEDGVSAYSAIMYIDFTFKSILIGYSVGLSPIVSYNFGAENKEELKNVFRLSVGLVLSVSLVMFVSSEVLKGVVVSLFSSNDVILSELLNYAFMIYAFTYIFCGVNIFASGFFTALCNGLVSGVISFAKGLVLPVIMITILTIMFGANGIWMISVVSELITMILSVSLLVILRKKYGYA